MERTGIGYYEASFAMASLSAINTLSSYGDDYSWKRGDVVWTVGCDLICNVYSMLTEDLCPI